MDQLPETIVDAAGPELEDRERGWPKNPGQVHMLLATWVPGKGWLATRRSVIRGGKHGEPALLDNLEECMEVMTVELRSGLAAMRYRLDQET